MSPRRASYRLLLLPFALLLLGHAWAADPFNSATLTEQQQRVDAISKVLDAQGGNTDLIALWQRDVTQIRRNANACVSASTERLERVKASLEALGSGDNGEVPEELVSQQKALDQDKSTQEKLSGTCKLLSLASEDLLARLDKTQQQLLRKRFFDHGPSLPALIYTNSQEPTAGLEATYTFLRERSGLERLSSQTWGLLAGLALFLVSAAAWLRRKLIGHMARRTPRTSLAERVMGSLFCGLAHYLPALVLATLLPLFFGVVTAEWANTPFITIAARGLPFYVLLLVAIRVVLAPPAPAQPPLQLPEGVAKALAARLRVLSLLLLLGYLGYSTLFVESLPEPTLLLARDVYFTVLVLNFIWVVRILGRLPELAGTRMFRNLLTLGLAAVMITAWSGYRALASSSLQALIGTLLLLGMFFLLHRLMQELYDGLEQARRPWHRRLRMALGLSPIAPLPHLIWLRFLTGTAIWGGFLIGSLFAWGLPEHILLRLREYALDGFSVGSLTIVPVRILMAIVVFVVLYLAGGWFRRHLEQTWTRRTLMDRGAREAMVTITGYLGTGIAILVGLAITGVEFAHLAIIAGALSVGIGFGLQNIVNNFVSGLILLFERPIKTGDWIVVGSTEGYVKRISIRSTQIQTFDKADVIVPNSELIAGQVTNWMLYDPTGRVRVPVGVAYGSDTEKVKALLLAAAEEHPEVITDGTVSPPKVLFLSFGDSALLFELRCFIRNVDARIQTLSDLNFAIDRLFRDNDITIPFPQQDVYIKEAPGAGPSKESAVPEQPDL